MLSIEKYLEPEKMRLLFNIAARKTSIASYHISSHSLPSAVCALYHAIELLQASIAFFKHVKKISPSTPNWTECDLQAIIDLLSAETQELYVWNAIEENLQAKEIASIAFSCHELYINSSKILNRSNEFILLLNHSSLFRKVKFDAKFNRKI